MPIRRSPNGAGYTRPQPGRDRPEWVVAINRNAWSQSIGIGGRNQPVRAHIGEYVRGDAHTNTIESVWALLKRQIVGTHHWVSPKHLDQYVSEMTWRMNRREMSAQERINALFTAVEGRLTYKALIS